VTRRGVAAFLLLAALGLHLGLASPARRQRDEVREAFARLRGERESLRVQIARLQRRAILARAPRGDAEAARALRRSLLGAVEGLPLRAVRISVEPGRRGVIAARGNVAAEGGQAALLRAAGKLAEVSSGVLLASVRLANVPGGDLRLEIEAFTLRAPSEGPDGGQVDAPASSLREQPSR
jgi:hypothetical protein